MSNDRYTQAWAGFGEPNAKYLQAASAGAFNPAADGSCIASVMFKVPGAAFSETGPFLDGNRACLWGNPDVAAGWQIELSGVADALEIVGSVVGGDSASWRLADTTADPAFQRVPGGLADRLIVATLFIFGNANPFSRGVELYINGNRVAQTKGGNALVPSALAPTVGGSTVNLQSATGIEIHGVAYTNNIPGIFGANVPKLMAEHFRACRQTGRMALLSESGSIGPADFEHRYNAAGNAVNTAGMKLVRTLNPSNPGFAYNSIPKVIGVADVGNAGFIDLGATPIPLAPVPGATDDVLSVKTTQNADWYAVPSPLVVMGDA